MHWVRRRLQAGSWAALFALAIQVALSFGHVHLDNIRGTSPSAVASLQLQDDDGAAPAGHGTPSGEHDYCAICAVLSLASNSVLPTVSLLATPISHHQEWQADTSALRISFVIDFLFQARAPPRSI
jgi:hypothetical protein